MCVSRSTSCCVSGFRVEEVTCPSWSNDERVRVQKQEGSRVCSLLEFELGQPALADNRPDQMSPISVHHAHLDDATMDVYCQISTPMRHSTDPSQNDAVISTPCPFMLPLPAHPSPAPSLNTTRSTFHSSPSLSLSLSNTACPPRTLLTTTNSILALYLERR
jgi:hypothetical protein